MASKDWVDQTVQEIWNSNPGIGVKECLKKVLEICEDASKKNHKNNNEQLPNEKNSPSSASSSSFLFSVSGQPQDPAIITKARIKQAKAWIPYRRITNTSPSKNGKNEERTNSHMKVTSNQLEWIESKIQERISLRAIKSFAKADELQLALEAMGVELDDLKKTWKLVRTPPSLQQHHDHNVAENVNGSGQTGKIATVSCKFCGKPFPSRNYVFKHLRDPTSGCGTAIFAMGKSIAPPPSSSKRNNNKSASHKRVADSSLALARNTTRTARHASAEQSLWIGDLPLPWTCPKKKFSRLRAILFQYIPRDIPRPWIKRVVRKAYRKQRDTIQHHFGYAIVVFRDAQEAEQVYGCLHQQVIDPAKVFSNLSTRSPPESSEETNCNKHSNENNAELETFTIKVLPVANGDVVAATWNTGMDSDDTATASATPRTGTSTPEQDPLLIDQLRPLSMVEIQSRIRALQLENRDSCFGPQHFVNSISPPKDESDTLIIMEQSLANLVDLYNNKGWQRQDHDTTVRPIRRRRQGRPVPFQLCQKLYAILSSLRWPARNERDGLAAERYLVLPTNCEGKDRFYGELRRVCRELMDWTDPRYYYSGIAVTKNFVASPHIDHRDTTFQYAISLGDFTSGGELCVEGSDGSNGTNFVNVISTKNSIARVDGRCVHWVRTFCGGDRYSLIFYDTSNRNPTPILESGVDEEFLQSLVERQDIPVDSKTH